MKITVKTKDILSAVVEFASVVVTIAKIWEENGPEIKNAVSSFVAKCKKIISPSQISGCIEKKCEA